MLLCCHGNDIWAIFSKISNCFFFFVFRWNRAIFWQLVLREILYKTLFFDFWFRPPNAQNLLPEICTCTKSPITRLVWQIDWRCLRLLGGFRGWPIQWKHAKCWGPNLVAMATKFGQIWAIFDKIAHESSCRPMPDRPDRCLGLPEETTRGGGRSCCHGNDICAKRGVYNRLPACLCFVTSKNVNQYQSRFFLDFEKNVKTYSRTLFIV